MDYIRKEADGQLTFTHSTEFLMIPSCLYGFHNATTSVKTAKSGRTVFCFEGSLDASEENLFMRFKDACEQSSLYKFETPSLWQQPQLCNLFP